MVHVCTILEKIVLSYFVGFIIIHFFFRVIYSRFLSSLGFLVIQFYFNSQSPNLVAYNIYKGMGMWDTRSLVRGQPKPCRHSSGTHNILCQIPSQFHLPSSIRLQIISSITTFFLTPLTSSFSRLR